MRFGVAVSFALSATAVAVLLALAAPGAEAHQPEHSEGRTGFIHHNVTIKNWTFYPSVLTIRAGEHVQVTNLQPGQMHSWDDVNGTFESPYIFPGRSYDWTSVHPGNYTLKSRYGVNMTMRLNIEHPPPANQVPTVGIVTPGTGEEVAGKIRVEGIADDPDGDPFHVFLRVNGGSWGAITPGWTWGMDWDTRAVKDGQVVVEAMSQDVWGAQSEPARIIVNVKNKVDSGNGKDAIVIITSPHHEETVSGLVVVEGIATASHRDLKAHVLFSVDSTEWQDAEGSTHWRYEWDSRTVKDGPHTMRALARDGRTYSSVYQITVFVTNAGTAQIAAAITTPQERAKVSGNVTFIGTASDPEDEDFDVYWRVDRGDWNVASGGNQWSFDWNSSRVANGPHAIEVVARTAGRGSGPARVTVFVDNGEAGDRPTVNILTPAENQRLSGTVLLRGNATGLDEIPLDVEIKIDDGPWLNVSGSRTWAYTLDTLPLPNGVHTVTARVFDGRIHSEERTVRFFSVNSPRSLVDESERSERQPLTPPRPPEPEPEEEPSKFGIPLAPGAAILALAAAAGLGAFTRRPSRPR